MDSPAGEKHSVDALLGLVLLSWRQQHNLSKHVQHNISRQGQHEMFSANSDDCAVIGAVELL